MRAVVYESMTDNTFPHLPFETSDAVAAHILATDYLPGVDVDGELATALMAIYTNLTATDLRNWIKTTDYPIPLNLSLEQTQLKIIKHIAEK